MVPDDNICDKIERQSMEFAVMTWLKNKQRRIYRCIPVNNFTKLAELIRV